MTNARLWPADPHATEAMVNFFSLEKAVREIEYELAHRPEWLRLPLVGLLRLLSDLRRVLMSKLSAEAYAIVEGRHADPFRYLGLHTEGDKTVVRAFLPEASNVEAVGEHGETAKLSRIHDAGLFAGHDAERLAALPAPRAIRRQCRPVRRPLSLPAGSVRL